MDKTARNSLIFNAAIEVIQNVLPTNILSSLNAFDDEERISDFQDDLEDDKFLHEILNFGQIQSPPVAERQSSVPPEIEAQSEMDMQELPDIKIQPDFDEELNFDDNEEMEFDERGGALTYYDIIDREMTSNISDENIENLQSILLGYKEIKDFPIADSNIRSTEQLTRLFMYILMTNENFETTEVRFDLKPGTVESVLRLVVGALVKRKSAFVRWPTQRQIDQCVKEYEKLKEMGQSEFYNVFSVIGTTDICVQPAMSSFLSVDAGEGLNYTPTKLQCCCNAKGIIQSSYVKIPSIESEAKNSSVFECNPIRNVMEVMNSSENYVVSDRTLANYSFLLTPHDDNEENAVPFNQALESRRKTIDKVFAKIESQFLILNRIEISDPNLVCDLIETICILHNFLLVNRDTVYISSE